MRKSIVLLIAIAFFFALTIPVSAETVFNEASKCIASWGKCSKDTSAPSATARGASVSKASTSVTKDVLNNTVPACTMKSGNMMARRATSCKMASEK